MLKRWISWVLILTLALFAAAGCKKDEKPKEEEKKPTTQQAPKEEAPAEEDDSFLKEDVVNIALLGIDTLADSMAGRSDTIIIASLDKKTKEIRLSAILRDSYVTMDHPERGEIKDKLNHAFAYGGGELTVQTLNQNFGLDIEYYAAVNFKNLEKLVDRLGGLEWDVSTNYRKEANHHITALANARKITPKLIANTGKQTLNGMQMLGILRARKQVGGVSVRSETNEKFLIACFEKIQKMSATEYPALAKEILGMIKTNLPADYITGVAVEVLTEDYEIRKEIFPLSEDLKGYGGKTIKGVYYTTFNTETAPGHLQDFIYEGKLPEKK